MSFFRRFHIYIINNVNRGTANEKYIATHQFDHLPFTTRCVYNTRIVAQVSARYRIGKSGLGLRRQCVVRLCVEQIWKRLRCEADVNGIQHET